MNILQREKNAMVDIGEHEHIPKLIGFGKTEYRRWVVQQFCGKNVDSVTRERGKTMNEEDAIILVKQVFLALRHIHLKGFVHNDVKPTNITVKDGKYYLVDYGLARRILPLKRKYRFEGTRKYAAIQAQVDHIPNPLNDYEALAYTYVALTNGKLPWEHANKMLHKNDPQANTIMIRMKKDYVNKVINSESRIGKFLALLKRLRVTSELPTEEQFEEIWIDNSSL